MMRCYILFSFCFIFYYENIAQVIGKYKGEANGDILYLDIVTDKPTVTGSMKDSGQSYTIEGKISGQSFKGTAFEASLGITIELSGIIRKDAIDMEGQIDLFGTKQPTFTTTFYKVDANMKDKNISNNAHSALPSALNGKSIDRRLIGTWRHENHYSSGYGDQAFSGSNYEYMQFNEDHTMSDRGSSASMSGSNYSGNSGGMNSGQVIPNLWYYTTGNKIMAVINQNGSYTTVELGTYFIENGNLLFTQINTGKKILYSKI